MKLIGAAEGKREDQIDPVSGLLRDCFVLAPTHIILTSVAYLYPLVLVHPVPKMPLAGDS